MHEATRERLIPQTEADPYRSITLIGVATAAEATLAALLQTRPPNPRLPYTGFLRARHAIGIGPAVVTVDVEAELAKFDSTARVIASGSLQALPVRQRQTAIQGTTRGDDARESE